MALLHIEPLPRRAGKSDVLALLDAAGLDRRHVGRIELRGKQAVVEIPDGWEARLVKALDGRHVRRPPRAGLDAAVRRTAGPSDEDDFLRLARLLDLESRAEAQQAADAARRLSPAEAEKTGNSLIDSGGCRRGGRAGRPLPGSPGPPRPRTAASGPGWTSAARSCSRPRQPRPRQSDRGVVCERSERTDLRRPRSPARRPGRPRRLAAGPVVRRSGHAAAAGRPGAGPACPRRPLRRSSATCSWAGGSRSSASIPQVRPLDRASTRCSARRCSSPFRPATWA